MNFNYKANKQSYVQDESKHTILSVLGAIERLGSLTN